MDFVSAGLATGCALRIFTLVDSFTRECLALEVGCSLSSRRVTRMLERVIEQRGVPVSIRCDNGNPQLRTNREIGGRSEA
jgi:putative transposase